MLLPPSMSSGPSPASIVSLPLLPRTLSASGDPVIDVFAPASGQRPMAADGVVPGAAVEVSRHRRGDRAQVHGDRVGLRVGVDRDRLDPGPRAGRRVSVDGRAGPARRQIRGGVDDVVEIHAGVVAHRHAVDLAAGLEHAHGVAAGDGDGRGEGRRGHGQGDPNPEDAGERDLPHHYWEHTGGRSMRSAAKGASRRRARPSIRRRGCHGARARRPPASRGGRPSRCSARSR